LIDLLSANPELRVAALPLAGRAEALDSAGADYLVHGSVQVRGKVRRLKLRLTNSATGQLLWSDTATSSPEAFLGAGVVEDTALALGAVIQYGIRNDDRPVSQVAIVHHLAGEKALRASTPTSDLDAIAKHFEQSLSVQPDFLPSILGLCRVLLRKYRRLKAPAYFNEAQLLCLKALELDETLVEVRITLADLYNTKGEHAKAQRVIERAIKLAPYHEPAHNQLAIAQEGQGRLEEAEQTLRRATASAPDSWEAYLAFGNFLAQHQRYEDAVEQYMNITKLEPDNHVGFGSVGVTYYEMAEWALAEEFLKRSIALHESDIAWFNLGMTYQNLGQLGDAKSAFRRSVDLNPGNYRNVSALADACQLSQEEVEARSYYEQALVVAEEHCRINASDAYTLSHCAVLEMRLGRDAAATERIATAIAVAAGNPKVHYNAAIIAYQAGDTERGVELMLEALEMGYPKGLFGTNADSEPFLRHERIRAALLRDE